MLWFLKNKKIKNTLRYTWKQGILYCTRSGPKTWDTRRETRCCPRSGCQPKRGGFGQYHGGSGQVEGKIQHILLVILKILSNNKVSHPWWVPFSSLIYSEIFVFFFFLLMFIVINKQQLWKSDYGAKYSD
jgi:hypothetical protein